MIPTPSIRLPSPSILTNAMLLEGSTPKNCAPLLFSVCTRANQGRCFNSSGSIVRSSWQASERRASPPLKSMRLLAGDVASAKALYEANREALGEDAVRLEAEIAKAEGADPVEEYIRVYETTR